MMTLAKPAKQNPNITSGATASSHSLRQFGKKANDKWVTRNISVERNTYLALGELALLLINRPTTGVDNAAAK